MGFSHYMTGVGLLKVIGGVLGFISFSVGTYCYFESDWKRKDLYSICTFCTSSNVPNEPSFYEDIFSTTVNCPNISLEVFYVVTTTIGFLVSTGFLFCAAVWPRLRSARGFKYLDIAFHGILCPLMLASACTFIYSAAKIDQLLDSGGLTCEELLEQMQLLTGGKIVAGIIAMKLGVIYGLVAYNIFQEVKSGQDSAYYIIE